LGQWPADLADWPVADAGATVPEQGTRDETSLGADGGVESHGSGRLYALLSGVPQTRLQSELALLLTTPYNGDPVLSHLLGQPADRRDRRAGYDAGGRRAAVGHRGLYHRHPALRTATAKGSPALLVVRALRAAVRCDAGHSPCQLWP